MYIYIYTYTYIHSRNTKKEKTDSFTVFLLSTLCTFYIEHYMLVKAAPSLRYRCIYILIYLEEQKGEISWILFVFSTHFGEMNLLQENE